MPKRTQQTGRETAEEEDKGNKRRKRATTGDSGRASEMEQTDTREPTKQANKHPLMRKKRKKKQQKLIKSGDPTPLPSRKEASLQYLHLWHTDREKWCFRKKPQFWLLQNMYDKTQVSA